MKQSVFNFRDTLFFLIGRPQSMRRIMMTVTGGFTLGMIVFVVLITSYFTSRAESVAWRGRQSEAARNASQTVGQFIQDAIDSLSLLNILEEQFLKGNPQVFQGLFDQNPSLLEIILLDAKGNVSASVSQDEPVLANLFTIPQSKWFQEATAGRNYISRVQSSSLNKPYLILAIPAKGNGVIAARMSMQVLVEVVADIRFGQTGRVYVINQSGEIIAHTNSEYAISHTNLKDRPEFQNSFLATSHEWLGEYTNFEGVEVVGVTYQVPETDWVLFAELPTHEAFAVTRLAPLLLGGGMVLFAIFSNIMIALLLENEIFRPAEKLREGVKKIGQGDFSYQVNLERNNEIGLLADAFDAMVVQLNDRAKQIEHEITERKQAEEIIRFNEARYRAIVEDQTELICRWKPDGVLTFVNEAYCRYFGMSRDDLIGHSFKPLIPDEDNYIIDNQFQLLGVENPVVSYEHRVIQNNGEIRWQGWTDRAIFDEQNNIVEIASVGRDITERQMIRLALQKKNLQQEKLIEIAHKMTASLDLTDVLTQIVMGAQEILDGSGCAIYLLETDRRTLKPVIVIDKLYQKEVESISLDIDTSFSGQAVKAKHSLIFSNASEDFSSFHIPGTPNNEEEYIITVPFTADNAVFGVMCLNRYDRKFDENDLQTAEVFATYASAALANSQAHTQISIEVEERKKAEAALRQSEKLYRLIAENITDIIWVRDMNLRLTYISPSVSRLRGFSVEEALTQTLQQICTPESALTSLNFFAQVLADVPLVSPEQLANESRTLELEMKRKDGSTVWTETVMRFILDQDNKPFEILGTTRDISERKQAEARLRRLNDELEDRVRQRTVQLSDVNRNLTTEIAERKHAEEIIRAALQEKEVLLKEVHHRVKNNLQVISSLLSLQARHVHDPEIFELLQESQMRIRSMALIHEKLYQSEDLSKIDLSSYVHSLASHLFKTYKSSTDNIQLNIHVDNIHLPIDKAVPYGLLLNELISNSLKHAFPDMRNGEIRVELKQGQNDQIFLTIEDNGVGIPEHIDFRASPSLGLQLIHTLVTQLDGAIELDRSHGTCFRINFYS